MNLIVGRSVVRRRNRRGRYVVLGVFVMVFLFTFMTQKFKGDNVAEAANLGAFDPGYIISDYQMGNYNAMSEADIQSFLWAKGRCYNTDFSGVKTQVDYFSDSTPPTTWHVKDGHTVCLAEENMNGETAAHIIWQAAQDYRINPQVLIVLLQKETGVITDPIPNSWDYQRATGYGCPDTAACSSKYYGFRNQVRNAASLFRYVLDNGSRYYPVGSTYVQYNPSSACGGSVVNIRNNATSALYQYTPYQPNAAALAAGYGYGDGCSAYGNRNFYSYFEDWFGGVVSEGYINMESPRYMVNRETGEIRYYTVKRFIDGDMCLAEDMSIGTCVAYSKLTNVDWSWQDMVTPRYLVGKSQAVKINLTDKNVTISLVGKTIYYNKKTILPDGRQCLLPDNAEKYTGWCAVFDTLEEAIFEENPMQVPRRLEAKVDTSLIDPITRAAVSYVSKGKMYDFDRKIYLPDVGMCLIATGRSECIVEGDLREAWNEMAFAREMIVMEDTYKLDVYSGMYDGDVLMNEGMKRRFVSKIYYGDEWCLRTEYDNNLGNNRCVSMSKLGETWNTLDIKEKKTIIANSQKIDAINMSGGLIMVDGGERFFMAKHFIASKMQWCYRTEYDTILATNYCFLESDLK